MREDDEETAEVWNSREACQKRGVTVPVSRPGALLRHPQESNPEVIREVSVGCSEKRRPVSREAVGARCTHTLGSRARKGGRKKDEAENAEEEEKEEKCDGRSADPLRFFLLLFGQFSATYKSEGSDRKEQANATRKTWGR